MFALAREMVGVELTGWLSSDAVQARMADAWSLLVPSIVASDGDIEGLPSVVPEAMAQGCVVIGSNEGGITEVIRDGINGLLVRPNDAAALSNAMMRVLEPALRHELSLAAFHAVGTTLNAGIQSKELEDLLLATFV